MQTIMTLVVFFSLSLIIHQTGADDLRLVSGANHCHGHLQVKDKNTWKEVFFSEIVLNTAAAVCERLNCGSALTLERKDISSQPALNIDHRCVPSKNPISDCILGSVYSPYRYSITCSEFVRLRRTHRLCSGPLEVNLTNSWSLVCEDDFGLKDAEVVCRELGCGPPHVLQGALHVSRDVPERQKFQCQGHEPALTACPRSNSDQSSCPSGKAVVLSCLEPVKLVGQSGRCAGTVQIKYRGQWRPLSIESRYLSEVTSVVCPLLDCGSPKTHRKRQFPSNRDSADVRLLNGGRRCEGRSAGQTLGDLDRGVVLSLRVILGLSCRWDPPSFCPCPSVSPLLSSEATMETSVTAAKVVLPPDVTERSLEEEEETAARASFSPMDEFRRRLDEIVSSYSNGPSVLEQQTWAESDMDKKKEEEDNSITVETEMSLIRQSLSQLSSPEDKLQELVKKYAEMASLRRSDEQKLCLLQHKFSRLLDERQLLQKEQRNNLLARSKLETLCRELQREYTELREETIERCREDEKKRNEMTSHFQEMLTEIQTQIEQHNTRNDKLCTENNNLTEKLESLMNQCELREESLEKINKHRDLQQKLTEARLAQANALLVEAEEKHKREKEYLLREAIDKTKKCFAMKEQELSMKKKLALYAQKFDEFQATLAKSNEIFHRFKKEMDTMSDKMKKMEKESNLWKTRFENCNKALTDMLEERTEKGKEYDLFVLKIQKLEKLCRTLQEERKILYDKIKDVRTSNANIPSKLLGLPPPESDSLLTHEDIDEMQSQDPVLTQDMARLKEEQAKLQLFADSLFDNDDCVEDVTAEVDLEEDKIASAFAQFKNKKDSEEVKEEEIKPEEASTQKEVQELNEVQQCPQEATQMEKPKDDAKLEQDATEAKVESTPAEETSESQNVVDLPKPELPEVEEVKVEEVKVEEVKVQEDKVEATVQEAKSVEAVEKSEEEPASKPASENSSESSKKQVPKKKKKRNNKNAS
ncbi:hypothetical protein WMY93_015919 [Mugilogobius chulae]|uniref:SRCR domain-containing protein n=1 Tax=Mugilogobius chulae TaxID=88201 RepID=A0AAW0NSK3_9GOBI